MASRHFAFEPPNWTLPDQAPLRTGLLLVATGIWTLLFAWLTWRLWHSSRLLRDPVNSILALGAVALGVVVALGWLYLLPRWRAWLAERRHGGAWSALSLEAANALTPSQFESYVAYRLFKRHGFTVENTRDVKDGGIDILVTDPLGRQSVVQCKRYRSTVGSPTVRDLYGTMIDAGAVRAYLVTSGPISPDARAWASGKPISLIDGERLAALAKAQPALDVMRQRSDPAPADPTGR